MKTLKNHHLEKLMNSIKQILCLSLFILPISLAAKENSKPSVKAQGGTGFRINNIRQFEFDQNTIIKEDGIVVPETRAQGGTGFKVRYKVGNDTNPEVTAGTLDEINLINTHKGPIISLDPFRIFNIDALITSDTFFDDDLLFDSINLGDELKVSGFVDSNSSLIVSRIESDTNPLTEWKLSGYISNLGASQFNIQNQVVMIGSIIADNCPLGLSDGEFVEVKSTPDISFTIGSALTTVTDIECVPQDINTFPGTFVPVALEGLIDIEDIEFNSQFSISGQQINVTGTTVYINGEIDDIVIGAKVEVEGLLDTTTSIINALKVKFKEVRFKFEEPVLTSDVIIGESIQLYGRTILTTPQLRDEDGIIGSGLGVETQVEVRGYADSDGNLYATRVRERGNPDSQDVSADGQITLIDQPMIEVFGVSIDTSNSIFLDINGLGINSTEFFNSITIGTELEVEMAVVNEVTNVLTGGIIRIDENDDVTRASKQGAAQALGIGTITSIDSIFKNSFE
jgi:hypothetical protein